MADLAPLVSIIIPNYDNANVISETLGSVANQTYANWEAIIVDDGSTDKSIEIIETFVAKDSRFNLYKRNRNPKGPSTCRNIGVEKSKGDYLVFLDSDDLLADFCLEQRLNYMNENAYLDFAVFKLELFNRVPGDLSIVFNKYPQKKDNYLKMFLRNELPWACPNPIWRKKSYLKLGGFNEDLIIMEDPELHTRALINGYKFDVVKNSQPDCYYRQNSFSQEKKEYFYELSIKGRIYYIKEMLYLLRGKNLSLKEYKRVVQNIRKGYISLVKGFFIARIKNFEELFFTTLKWCKKEKVIYWKDFILIKLLAYSWLSQNRLIKLFRIKGLLLFLIR